MEYENIPLTKYTVTVLETYTHEYVVYATDKASAARSALDAYESNGTGVKAYLGSEVTEVEVTE